MVIKRTDKAPESESLTRAIVNGAFRWGNHRSPLVFLWVALGIALCILVGTAESQAELGGENSSSSASDDPPPKPSDIERCRSSLEELKNNNDNERTDSTQNIQSITYCVQFLIASVNATAKKIQEVQLPANTPFRAYNGETAKQDNAINGLTDSVENLLKSTKQLSKDLRCQMLIVCVVVLFCSFVTSSLITHFMKEHYEPLDDKEQSESSLSPTMNGILSYLKKCVNNAFLNRPRTNVFSEDRVARLLVNAAEQISQEERHYSNLRFALFTLFMAVSGVLGALYLNKDYVAATQSIHTKLPIIGLLLTIVFASLEFAIDWIETEYSYMGRAVWKYWQDEIKQGGGEVNTKKLLDNPNSLSIGGVSPPISWVRGPIWGIFFLAALLWITFAESTQVSSLAWFLSIIATIVFWFFLFLGGNLCAKRTRSRI